MLAGHGAELSTSREDDVRRGAADELDGRRAGLDDEAGREAVDDGGWAWGAAVETGCGGETARNAGWADGTAGRG